MDVPSSTNDAVQRPVIYKIVEKDAGYQELGALSLSDESGYGGPVVYRWWCTTHYDPRENRGGC